MKKMSVLIAMTIATFGLFAQSAEYTKYLNQAKKYETEKRWCFALDSYYDAMATDDDPEVKQEACEAYNELQNVIKEGNPGKGKYNAFTLHDEWKNLLIDAEKYGSSICKYDLKIGPLVQGDLDYTTKTATYTASVEYVVGDRYKKTIEVIKEGYEKAYQKDWSSDLPKKWPYYSVSSKKNSVYNVNGALIFNYILEDLFTDYDEYINAFEGIIRIGVPEINFYGQRYLFDLDVGLYDLKFSIVDEAGKELGSGKRCLLGREEQIIFPGVTPSVFDLIDNGKVFIKPVAVYLEYGKYDRNKDDFIHKDTQRLFMKDFAESKVNIDKIAFHGTNLNDDKREENVSNTLSWKEDKAKEQELQAKLEKKQIEYKKRKTVVDAVLADFKFVSIPEKDYLMSTTEVTQKLYEAVMGENPSYFKGESNPVESVSMYDVVYFCNKLSELEGKTPVYSVNGNTDVTEWGYTPHKDNGISGRLEWNETANGYRLPTEQEWEYSANGGKNYEYSGSELLLAVGWYIDNSGNKTHPVGKKKANRYGLFDMSGNVWEWTISEDRYGDGYCRGGSYRSGLGSKSLINFDSYRVNKDSEPEDCKVTSYKKYEKKSRASNLGFRVVQNAD